MTTAEQLQAVLDWFADVERIFEKAILQTEEEI